MNQNLGAIPAPCNSANADGLSVVLPPVKAVLVTHPIDERAFVAVIGLGAAANSNQPGFRPVA